MYLYVVHTIHKNGVTRKVYSNLNDEVFLDSCGNISEECSFNYRFIRSTT